MSIFTNLWQKAVSVFAPASYVTERMPRVGKALDPDPKQLVTHYGGWVYVCASRIAETIVACPLKLYVKGGSTKVPTRKLGQKDLRRLEYTKAAQLDDLEEITEGHPLLDLLDSFNPHITRSEGIEQTVLYEELVGSSYWYIEPGPLGVPKNIWPLMSQYMRVVPSPDNYVQGYLYGRTTNEAIAFAPEEIIQFKYFNPGNAYYGMGTLQAVLGAAVLLESEQEYERSQYDNGGMPETIITSKSAINAQESARLRAEWKQKWGRRANQHVPAVLSGDVTITTLGYPPKDMGVLASRQFNRQEIAGAFGLPMTMIELSESSKAGAVAGHYSYMKYTIEPKLIRLGQTLTERLAARYDPRLVLMFDSPVPEDNEFMLREREVNLRTKFSTVNEERAKVGLEPVEWGDKPPEPPPNPFAQLPPQDGNPPKPDAGNDMPMDADQPQKALSHIEADSGLHAALSGFYTSYTEQIMGRVDHVAPD